MSPPPLRDVTKGLLGCDTCHSPPDLRRDPPGGLRGAAKVKVFKGRGAGREGGGRGGGEVANEGGSGRIISVKYKLHNFARRGGCICTLGNLSRHIGANQQAGRQAGARVTAGRRGPRRGSHF